MRRPTVIRFIVTGVVVYFTILLIVMCALFFYTTEKARHDTARWTVERGARTVSRHLQRNDDGIVTIDEETLEEMEDYYAVVISSKDGFVTGNLPDELDDISQLAPEHKKFRVIRREGKTFYVYDNKVMRFQRPHRRNYDNSEEYYVRAVVCFEDLYTVYQSIERLFSGLIVLFVIIAAAGGVILYKKAAKPVREMCDNVKKLSDDAGYSKKIKNTSIFYETEVMAEAYNKLTERNKQLIEQQEGFNENVSHELRTPVAVIRSEVELIRDLHSDSIPPEANEAINIVHTQTDRINAMIVELMYMAKMNRENFALTKETMDLSDLAESVCDDIEDAYPGSRVFRYHWEPAEADIDVELIMIAVRNLINNAFKFSPEGSTIDLYSGSHDGMAFLKVKDEGIGIAEEDITRIFNPYYQSSGSRNNEGFGLGLSLAMKVAVKHGGTILVESEEGKGSTFTLMLPIH